MIPVAPPEPVWGVVDTAAFDRRQWGDDIVLYVVATGETHALAPAHSGTLALMLDHPGTVRTALEWLNVMTDEGEFGTSTPQQDQADLAAIQTALADLHRLGVVQRVPA